ncbi:hypothetical protein GGI43DRAFT_431349 [Trichoderma evansii]
MQFMSQAMGIADCILLAVAPIGAITTVVSAIRVAGPSWLKSFIGRARENLAAAEVEVMSSTSEETCELWNGNSVKFNIRCEELQNIEIVAEKPAEGDKSDNIKINAGKPAEGDNTEDITKYELDKQETEISKKAIKKPELLQKKEKAGPTYAWQCLRNNIRLSSDNLKPIYPLLPHKRKCTKSDPENQLESSTGNSKPSISKMPASSNISSTEDSKNKEELELVIAMDTSNDNVPNLLLNCHDRVGRSEIYLAAAFGVVLQLGAIIYFGVITHHEPIQTQFLKDGKTVVKYAFPCAAVGTVLLVFGLFLCSWVVGKSTKETYYEAENHQIFIAGYRKTTL